MITPREAKILDDMNREFNKMFPKRPMRTMHDDFRMVEKWESEKPKKIVKKKKVKILPPGKYIEVDDYNRYIEGLKNNEIFI